MSLSFVSNNEAKHSEYADLLGIALTRVPFSNTEVVEDQLVKLTRAKVDVANELANPPFFVEHTALYVKGLQDWPGTGTEPFLKRLPPAQIISLHDNSPSDDRKTVAHLAIGYLATNDSNPVIIEASVSGHIATEERGLNGFGWDGIFIPDGCEKTYAEMTLEKKNETSMRADAVRQFLVHLVNDGVVTKESAAERTSKWTNPYVSEAGKAAAKQGGLDIAKRLIEWFT